MDKIEIESVTQEMKHNFIIPVTKQVRISSVVSEYSKYVKERTKLMKNVTSLLQRNKATHKRLQEYIRINLYSSDDNITSTDNQLSEFKKECIAQDKDAELYERALKKITQLEKELLKQTKKNQEYTEENEKLKVELENEHSARIEAEQAIQTCKKRNKNTKNLINKTPELTKLIKTIEANPACTVSQLAELLCKEQPTIKIQLREICEKIYDLPKDCKNKGLKRVKSFLFKNNTKSII